MNPNLPLFRVLTGRDIECSRSVALPRQASTEPGAPAPGSGSVTGRSRRSRALQGED